MLETNARVAGCCFFSVKKGFTHIIGMVLKEDKECFIAYRRHFGGEKMERENACLEQKKC